MEKIKLTPIKIILKRTVKGISYPKWDTLPGILELTGGVPSNVWLRLQGCPFPFDDPLSPLIRHSDGDSRLNGERLQLVPSKFADLVSEGFPDLIQKVSYQEFVEFYDNRHMATTKEVYERPEELSILASNMIIERELNGAASQQLLDRVRKAMDPDDISERARIRNSDKRWSTSRYTKYIDVV